MLLLNGFVSRPNRWDSITVHAIFTTGRVVACDFHSEKLGVLVVLVRKTEVECEGREYTTKTHSPALYMH